MDVALVMVQEVVLKQQLHLEQTHEGMLLTLWAVKQHGQKVLRANTNSGGPRSSDQSEVQQVVQSAA